MTTFHKLRVKEMDQEGKRHGHPESVVNLVRLICIERIDSWALTKKDEWIQFKKQLEEGEDKGELREKE